MQNKTLSLLSALLLSVAFFSVPVSAQEATPVLPTPDAAESPADIAARTEAAKKMLEESLGSTDSSADRTAVNFPSRPSLGSIELAPLPGIQETLITGPAPVEKSISKKDLPSEQLLGRITSEIFQEMADLERGNAFLKLQTQKETLRNDLEKLKTQYRESRLAEITKREEIVKERIKWWQEQEEQRLLLEKKKQETALIEQQIADAEATRERLRQEALDKRAAAQAAAAENPVDGNEVAAAPVVVETIVDVEYKPLQTLYSLAGIRGVRGELSARLKSSDGKIKTVRIGDKLPSGHTIKSITKDSVTATVNGIEDVLAFTSEN